MMPACRFARYDCHVHSVFSPDSLQPMQGQCERALELGLDGLCFTEHLDFDALSLGYYNPQAYFNEISRLRDVYAGRLDILSGLEFSEPHLHPRELEQAQNRPYDFILGSVHYWMGALFPSEMQDMGLNPADCFARYWEQMRLMMQCGGFDCAAHLDFPKRYFRCLEFDPGMLGGIFSAMTANGIVLEINTSSLRKGLADTLPGEDLLRRYIAAGGEYVTLGSDAHTAEELYADVPQAQALAQRLGLQVVRFAGRKMII